MPFNFPVEVKCEANTPKWTVGRKIILQQRESVLKRVLIWFSPGCSGKVYIRIMKNGNLFLPKMSGYCKLDPPDPAGYGNSYTGDNMTWPIHCPTVLTNNDTLTIEYINNDGANDHQIVVHIESVLKPAGTEVDTEGTGAGRRKPLVEGEIRAYSPEMSATEISVNSPSASRNARPKSREELLTDDGYERVEVRRTE